MCNACEKASVGQRSPDIFEPQNAPYRPFATSTHPAPEQFAPPHFTHTMPLHPNTAGAAFGTANIDVARPETDEYIRPDPQTLHGMAPPAASWRAANADRMLSGWHRPSAGENIAFDSVEPWESDGQLPPLIRQPEFRLMHESARTPMNRRAGDDRAAESFGTDDVAASPLQLGEFVGQLPSFMRQRMPPPSFPDLALLQQQQQEAAQADPQRGDGSSTPLPPTQSVCQLSPLTRQQTKPLVSPNLALLQQQQQAAETLAPVNLRRHSVSMWAQDVMRQSATDLDHVVTQDAPLPPRVPRLGNPFQYRPGTQPNPPGSNAGDMTFGTSTGVTPGLNVNATSFVPLGPPGLDGNAKSFVPATIVHRTFRNSVRQWHGARGQTLPVPNPSFAELLANPQQAPPQTPAAAYEDFVLFPGQRQQRRGWEAGSMFPSVDLPLPSQPESLFPPQTQQQTNLTQVFCAPVPAPTKALPPTSTLNPTQPPGPPVSTLSTPFAPPTTSSLPHQPSIPAPIQHSLGPISLDIKLCMNRYCPVAVQDSSEFFNPAEPEVPHRWCRNCRMKRRQRGRRGSWRGAREEGGYYGGGG